MSDTNPDHLAAVRAVLATNANAAESMTAICDEVDRLRAQVCRLTDGTAIESDHLCRHHDEEVRLLAVVADLRDEVDDLREALRQAARADAAEARIDAIADDKARAVEAERVRLWHAVLSDLRNVAGVDAAEGKPPVGEFNALLDGLRPVLSRPDAELLVGAYGTAVDKLAGFSAEPPTNRDHYKAQLDDLYTRHMDYRAALLAALTGTGGGS